MSLRAALNGTVRPQRLGSLDHVPVDPWDVCVVEGAMYGQLYVETIVPVGLAILVCVGAVWFAARVATRVADGAVDVLWAFIFSTIIVNRVPLALKWHVSSKARHHLTD